MAQTMEEEIFELRSEIHRLNEHMEELMQILEDVLLRERERSLDD